MARKDVAAIVSGAGWIASFADKLIRALRECGVSDEQIHSLVTDDGEAPVGRIADILAEMMRPEMRAWRTLTIGGLSKDELLQRLGDGFCVSDWARDIMSQPGFTTLPEPTDVHLARAKVKDLGFTEPPTTAELFTRIKEVGELCPAETGPHLRLADTDQVRGTYWVAMEPITDSDGDPYVFYVRRFVDGERWLHARYTHPGCHWLLEDEVVFRPRK